MNNQLQDIYNIISRKEDYLLTLDENTKIYHSIYVEIKILKRFVQAYLQNEERYNNEIQALLNRTEKLNMEKFKLQLICVNHGIIDFVGLACKPVGLLYDEFKSLIKENSFIMPFGLRPQHMPEASFDKDFIQSHFDNNKALIVK